MNLNTSKMSKINGAYAQKIEGLGVEGSQLPCSPVEPITSRPDISTSVKWKFQIKKWIILIYSHDVYWKASKTITFTQPLLPRKQISTEVTRPLSIFIPFSECETKIGTKLHHLFNAFSIQMERHLRSHSDVPEKTHSVELFCYTHLQFMAQHSAAI